MTDIENKILLFLESGYKIDDILKELDIDEENLADIVIELDNKELIMLEDNNWILTQKGKDLLKEMKELIKKLKVDYLHGNINKEEFHKRKKELEYILTIEKEKPRGYESEGKRFEDKEKDKIICPKCGKENKVGSKFCYKCGEQIKK